MGEGKKRKKKPASQMETCALSPVSALGTKYCQAASRGHPSLKRLKHRAKPVPSRDGDCPPAARPGASAEGRSHAHTNGDCRVRARDASPSLSPAPSRQRDSTNWEESDQWSSYAEMAQQNGLTSSGTEPSAEDSADMEDGTPWPAYQAAWDEDRNRTLLVMTPGQTLVFRGRCRLTCLYGRVEVLGFTVEEGQQPYPVFSPPTHCPLSLTALGHTASGRTKKERRLEAKSLVRKYLPTEAWRGLRSGVTSNSCLVLLEPLDTPLTRFLSSLPEHRQLFGFSAKERAVQPVTLDCPLSAIGMLPLQGGGGLVMSQSYRNAIDQLVSACREDSDGCPVILVCGSKNMGKSTFNRHLINTLLNHTVSVEYLECDLGQTEFTPPGCLSLLSITEPLLGMYISISLTYFYSLSPGVPFTHQRSPDKMVFYGESSCERDLDRYMDSVKFLWRSYRRETPIVINTMGWVKGFGFQLLVDLIRLLSVTHVVQLSHGDSTQFPALSHANLSSAPGWITTPRGQRTYRSNVLRDLSLLGYFSQLQDPQPGPVRPLHCITPYQVPMSAVALRVTHCDVSPAHVLYTANGSLVGLCYLAEKVGGTGGPVLLSHIPVCQCLGFGVDMARELYYVVTPLDPSLLRRVNCLLVGGVTLPHTLYRTQTGVEGERPYVTLDYSFEISGAGKLRVRKGLRRREHL
ncbi:NOL9 kinase, partial [Amia calva]|nr:NOL9 kinase [Amia calva]